MFSKAPVLINAPTLTRLLPPVSNWLSCSPSCSHLQWDYLSHILSPLRRPQSSSGFEEFAVTWLKRQVHNSFIEDVFQVLVVLSP